MSQSCAAISVLIFSAVTAAQPYVISTVAGGAPPSTPAAAASVSLSIPGAVAADSAGNIYFAAGWCVFKVYTSGAMTRIAGNGKPGYSGDGGPATGAQLWASFTNTIAVDSQGNVFVSDQNRVRRISPSGTITTVAGNGRTYSGDGGPATSAGLDAAYCLAIDGRGALVITDYARIRKVSPDGIITTIAGTGKHGYSGDGGPAISAQLGATTAVAIGADGSIFVAEYDNGRVRKISPDGIITTVAGGGNIRLGDGSPATTVQLFEPTGLAADRQGNIFIAEQGAKIGRAHV